MYGCRSLLQLRQNVLQLFVTYLCLFTETVSRVFAVVLCM